MIIRDRGHGKVIHTGLYGERAKQFFTWFRYCLLENYSGEPAHYSGEYRIKLAKLGETGLLMHVENAPDGEILLSSYPLTEGDLTDLPLSALNRCIRPICPISSIGYGCDWWNVSCYGQSNLFDKLTSNKQKEWLAVYIKKVVTDSNYLYTYLFNSKGPIVYDVYLRANNEKLQRKSDDVRVSLTMKDLSSLVGNKDAYVQYSIATARGVTTATKQQIFADILQDASTITLQFTDAEIMFMFDYLLGRKIDRSKYKNVDFESFYGQPRSPIIAEMEIEYLRMLKEADENYNRQFRLKADELSGLCIKEVESVKAKYNQLRIDVETELKQLRDKKIAEAQNLRKMINEASVTLNEMPVSDAPAVLSF